jgi:hypothetical protein
MRSINKIELAVKIIRLSLITAIIISFFYASWFNLFISSLTIILTFLPSWFEKKYSIIIPLDFEFAIILFIYASLFLGEVNNFYTHFWWWDVMLHSLSALAFALIGFIILFILFQNKQGKQQACMDSRIFLLLFHHHRIPVGSIRVRSRPNYGVQYAKKRINRYYVGYNKQHLWRRLRFLSRLCLFKRK